MTHGSFIIKTCPDYTIGEHYRTLSIRSRFSKSSSTLQLVCTDIVDLFGPHSICDLCLSSP